MRGVATLNTVSADLNGNGGVWLDNCLADTANVCYGSGGVTLVGANEFSFNGSDGLYIQSAGAVKLSNFNALGNLGSGILVDNRWEKITGGVTLNVITGSTWPSGINQANDNLLAGVNIYSNGAVIVDKLQATGNGNDGAYIINKGLTLAKSPVTVTNSDFQGNGKSADSEYGAAGLYIVSYGNVIIKGVTADDNSVQFGSIAATGETVYDRHTLDGLAEDWTFSLATDQNVTIYLDSEEFDPTLELSFWNPELETYVLVTSNDDCSSSTNSCVEDFYLLAGDYPDQREQRRRFRGRDW